MVEKNDRELVIDAEECIGCGACEDLCPGVFSADEPKGVAYVINPHGASEEEIAEAMELCPTRCIRWESEEGE
jgi:ferredoxin